MSLTRRDYNGLAKVVHDAPMQEASRVVIAHELGRWMKENSRLDVNGNRLFDMDRWLLACDALKVSKQDAEVIASRLR